MTDKTNKTEAPAPTEAELDDNQLEAAAGGRGPIFEDRNENGIPDIFEPSPTFPTFD
ncbi:MAG: hypothetical protein AAGI52_10760 [Bacteroidota bacterium]